jgi:2-oxoisovalerate dehydrogenase E1 component
MTGLGVGLVLAMKMRGQQSVVACIIGDGTLGEGLTYESLNLASIWGVPMLFVVENNGIAQTTRTSDTIGGSILARGAAFGLHTWHVDDSHPEMFAQIEDVVRAVRSLGQPGFLVIDTMRLGPHSKGDDLRDDAEMASIRARDPLARLGVSLAPAVREAIERRNTEFIGSVRDLGQAAKESRFELPPAHLFEHRSPIAPARTRPASSLSGPSANVRSALNASLRRLLADHPEVILLGEDLHDPYGGAFKVTTGLSTDFPGRVISTPISEAGVAGAAIGLALAGYRPIAEVMFADFLTLAMDQLYNHAVKFPGMFEEMPVPMVIRTPSGGRRGYGPTHSQSPEHLMTAVPGLTVVFPSHRHDVGRLLETASIDWGFPVVFFEHKLLYGASQDQGDYEIVPAAEADPGAFLFPTLVRRKTDPDLTIVAYGGMLPTVEAVAGALADEDLAVEIVAPSLLQPLPKQTLFDVLRDRGRVAIVEESPLGPGFGSELAATLLEQGFLGRLTRLGPPPVPIPAARSLESSILPDERRLFDALVTFVPLPIAIDAHSAPHPRVNNDDVTAVACAGEAGRSCERVTSSPKSKRTRRTSRSRRSVRLRAGCDSAGAGHDRCRIPVLLWWELQRTKRSAASAPSPDGDVGTDGQGNSAAGEYGLRVQVPASGTRLSAKTSKTTWRRVPRARPRPRPGGTRSGWRSYGA